MDRDMTTELNEFAEKFAAAYLVAIAVFSILMFASDLMWPEPFSLYWIKVNISAAIYATLICLTYAGFYLRHRMTWWRS
jgi:hypothetical protein